jgi:hypothetical protein
MVDHASVPNPAMSQPPPQSADRTPQDDPLDERTRAMCELRYRLTELHAQLEYLKLMLELGVR